MFEKILLFAENLGNKIAKIEINAIGFFKLFGDMIGPESNHIYYQIKPFRDNENSIAHFMGFLSNYTNIKKQITFFVNGNAKDIKLYAKVPLSLKTYFENTFYISFPTSDLTLIENKTFDLRGSYIRFKNAEILSDQDFVKNGVYLDPFKDLISIFYDINPKDGDISIFYDITFKTNDFFIIKLIKWFAKIFEKTPEGDKGPNNFTDQKFKFSIGFASNISDHTTLVMFEKNLKMIFDKFQKGGKTTIFPLKIKRSLGLNQLVNFFHIPTKDNYIKNLDYLVYRKLPYSPKIPTLENTPNNDITLLGFTDFKSDNIKFGIRKEDKFRHIYTIGKTGMGKSTLLSNMARSDMVTNNGLAVVDPHGDLIETLLEHVPSYRTNDVILFDVSDTAYPIGFNVFEYRTEEEKNLVSSSIVSVFKKLYGTSRGPRLEYILRNVVLALIEYPGATLLHLNRMLIDKSFREEVLSYVKDSVVLKFRRGEFDKRTDKFRDEAIAPITNKVGQFLSSPLMRNIFGQPKTKINFRQIMDEGKVLLINLSKGKIGEDNAAMVGSFFVSKFQIDAMSRADIPANKRKDFYLYIDEFQNFATDSFESILSEARKYKLSLIVANQYISQIDEKIRNAIFGNVGTIISFALGHDDSVIMSQQFKGLISPNDLLSLPKFRAYGKIMIDGVSTDPFSMTTFPLPNPENGEEIADKIRKQSRQRYAMERGNLENLIKIWSDKTFSAVEKVMEQAQKEAEEEAQNQKDTTIENNITDTAQDIVKTQEQMIEKKTENSPVKFSMDSVKIGERYDGLVKLKYNYGLFVTVKGVEGLLHKKTIKLPNPEIRRKDLYNIGDKIKVKAYEIKEMEGERKIVWTQLDE